MGESPSENEKVDRLVADVPRGDPKAFADLVRKFEGRVAATIIGMLRDCPEADDIGQETFIHL